MFIYFVIVLYTTNTHDGPLLPASDGKKPLVAYNND